MEFTDLELVCLWHRLLPSDKDFKEFYSKQALWSEESKYYPSHRAYDLWNKIDNEITKRGLINDAGYPDMFELRSPRKEMTQEEIEQVLGYKIKLVSKVSRDYEIK